MQLLSTDDTAQFPILAAYKRGDKVAKVDYAGSTKTVPEVTVANGYPAVFLKSKLDQNRESADRNGTRDS